MRALPLILAVLVVLIQYPLWRLDKGGWLHVWELDRHVSVKIQSNDALQARNQALAAEVRDLQQGHLAVEERARYELGMIGPDEVFIQINVSPNGRDGAATGLHFEQTAGR